MELYYGDITCSKCMTESFVSYLANDIQAYKYNILMTLQSAIASNFTVIAGILVCNVKFQLLNFKFLKLFCPSSGIVAIYEQIWPGVKNTQKAW